MSAMSKKTLNVLKCPRICLIFLKIHGSSEMSKISTSVHRTSIDVHKCPQMSEKNNQRPKLFLNVLKCPQCP